MDFAISECAPTRRIIIMDGGMEGVGGCRASDRRVIAVAPFQPSRRLVAVSGW